MIRLPIGQYFERFLDWAVVNCADFTRWCSGCIDSVVDGLKNILCAPPEWAMLLIFCAVIFVVSGHRKLLTSGSACGMMLVIMLGLWEPAMETMGVLNSCEKLLMKSERSISVPSSSAAMVLKLSVSSRTTGRRMRSGEKAMRVL